MTQGGLVATHVGPLGGKGSQKSPKKGPGTNSHGARMDRGGTGEAPGMHRGCTEDAPRKQLGIGMGPRANHYQETKYKTRSNGGLKYHKSALILHALGTRPGEFRKK